MSDIGRLDLSELDDHQLIARHVDGDPEAFGQIFRRHRDRMWAVAIGVTRDRELAEDAVQDAAISAYRRAQSFRGDSAVTTWLHRIVVNACLDRLRRERPMSDIDGLPLADPRDHHDAAEARLDVRAALSRLPERQRVALVLVDMEGLSVAEAAEILDVPEGTVKSRCSRGRAAIAADLGLVRPDPEPSAS